MNIESEDNTFKNLMEYARAMHKRYFHALSAFYVYEGLSEATAPNIVGQVLAENNTKVISNFINFFMPTKEALRVYFLLELAKMLDSSESALHINKILTITEGNLKNLTVDAFKEYNQGRVFIEELAAEYRSLDYKEVSLLRDMIDKNKVLIERLKIYRDKWLAHDDIKKPEPPLISRGDVGTLFGVLEKILNFITGKLNSESWAYSRVEDESKHHTRLVIDYLRRFEPYRLAEIQKEFDEDMRLYGSENKN